MYKSRLSHLSCRVARQLAALSLHLCSWHATSCRSADRIMRSLNILPLGSDITPHTTPQDLSSASRVGGCSPSTHTPLALSFSQKALTHAGVIQAVQGCLGEQGVRCLEQRGCQPGRARSQVPQRKQRLSHTLQPGISIAWSAGAQQGAA